MNVVLSVTWYAICGKKRDDVGFHGIDVIDHMLIE